MLRTTLRSLWAHKRRLVSTIVAIVLGVAFMAGTFVLSDTLGRIFDDLFADTFEQVDAQVQGEVTFGDPMGFDDRVLLEPGLVEDVRAVEGVALAEGFVTTVGFGSTNRVLDPEGRPIGAAAGPPTLIESWVTEADLSPYRLVAGRGPEADDEMALNTGAAEGADLAVGDTVTVVTQFGPSDYTLVGTFTFGTAPSAAGAVSAEFTLSEAQRLAGTGESIQTILIAAADGLSQDELVARIDPILPDGVEVITGVEAAAQLSDDVQSGFEFFRIALQIFAGIALLVGAFVISNTFAILVAQRTRELALLRALGAGRGQVLGSVLLEAVLVGLLAAALGLAAGIGLAQLVTTVLDTAGADLPTTTLLITGRTVAAAFVVGVAVTLVAALTPAVRATRVPPLAALRDVAIDRSGTSRVRLVLGLLALAVGAVNLAQAWTADGDTDVVPTVGFGALLLIVGAIVVGPVLAGPSVRVLGALLPRLRGVTGRLATENAARSPKRTSATASALLIGVALVGFITVFASSATTSVRAQVDRGFAGDVVIQSENNAFGPPRGFPTTVASDVATVEGIELVTAVGFAGVEATYPDGSTGSQFLTAIEPATITEVLDPTMAEGRVTDLTDDGMLLDRQQARRNDVAIGDRITLTARGGRSATLTVQGISDDTVLLGFATISRATFLDLIPEPLDAQLVAKVTPGADLDAVIESVEAAVAGVPALTVLDRDGFIGNLADQITSFVTVIYGLLILSIVIALIGIANTLSLSINERTRELGLLRAVGMDQRQLRSAVRWEAVLISVLGTLVGLGVGMLVSLALVTALSSFGLTTFSVPVGSIAVIVVLAALLGTLASVRPARRAARLDVLDAIATE